MAASLFRRIVARKFGPTFTVDEVMSALYRGILDRDLGPADMAWYPEKLQGGATLEQLASIIAASEEAQRLRGIVDHSQFGELRILLDLMIANATRQSVIVDVGARGKQGSNSYDLMKTFGWRGLLIEANPALWNDIAHDFAGLDFKLVRCGVSTTTGKADLFLGVNDDISSLDAQATSSWGAISGQVQIETRRLGDILQEHKIPKDFEILSVDIEGLDVPVLLDLLNSTDYAPRWIVVEVLHQSDVTLDDIGLSSIAGRYRVAAQTLPNVILETIAD